MAEKIDLNELKTEQAKIKFEEHCDSIINDPQLPIDCLQYLKSHQDEYKNIFGYDLKIED